MSFICLSVYAGDPWRPAAGADNAGIGYSCVMRTDFWSAFHNQAGLAFRKNPSAGLNVQNRFGLRMLGTRTAAIIIPSGRATAGAVYSNFGNSDFSRHAAGLACGIKLSDKLAAGVQADYFLETGYGEYNSRDALSFEAGILFMPSETVVAGIHLFNPFYSAGPGRDLPGRIRAGAGISLSGELFASAEAEMSTAGKVILKTGLEYEVMKCVRLRGGFSSDNNSFCFGTGYDRGMIRLDAGFVTHEMLGITSSASIIFNLETRRK